MYNPHEHLVLIADDDPDVRMLVSTALGREGYPLIEACDGVEALELIEQRSPSLALLDINMPRLDGVAVAEKLRKDGVDTPFIFVTALTRRADLDRAISTCPAGYLAKPFRVEKLRDQVRAALLDA
ncbi:MAG TPA: response regulator [Thermoleophilaceae bacterium]|jgi:two-component system response regulator MprA